MSLDFGSLSDLADTTRGRARTPWAPPTPEGLRAGTVLAFDQSLAATGWVWVTSTGTGYVEVMQADTHATPKQEHVKGIEEDFIRADHLRDYASGVIAQVLEHTKPAGTLEVYHEFPSVNSTFSTLSSVIAGYAVRQAGGTLGLAVAMLGAQPAKKLVCGNPNATKPEAHRGLKVHCAPWVVNYDRYITNEAKRDALCLALLALQ